jgi:hypothetical protein
MCWTYGRSIQDLGSRPPEPRRGEPEPGGFRCGRRDRPEALELARTARQCERLFQHCQSAARFFVEGLTQ